MTSMIDCGKTLIVLLVIYTFSSISFRE